MIKPVLSIIIVSYNTAKITLDCIKSINQDRGLDLKNENNDRTPTEIIVVDNNSHDDSVLQIKTLIKKLKINNFKLIENKDNAGFGKANNQALAEARGNYILFLNSDTIILHSAISQSLNWLSSHPEANICTGQLINSDGSIQATGGFFPNLANIFTWCLSLDDLPLVNQIIRPLHPHTPNFYTRDKFYLYDHEQDWVTGAFMLTRKSILDKSGGFDEDYFMYGEEVELSYRIKKSDPNGQTWYLVGPQIIHLGGASSPTKSAPLFKEYQGIINFFAKHKPRWQLSAVTLLLSINRQIRVVIYNLLGKTDIAKLYQQNV